MYVARSFHWPRRRQVVRPKSWAALNKINPGLRENSMKSRRGPQTGMITGFRFVSSITATVVVAREDLRKVAWKNGKRGLARFVHW